MAVAPQVVSSPDANVALAQSAGRSRIARFSVVVFCVVLAITAAAAYAASVINDRNNTRLLGVQTKQAASVLTAALPSIETPLASAAEIAATSNGNAAQVGSYLSSFVEPKGPFAAASLWRLTGTMPTRLAVAGQSRLASPPGGAKALISAARRTHELAVEGLLTGPHRRIAYAYTPIGSSPRFAVTATSVLAPSTSRAVVPIGSPFSELNFAIYFGKTARPSDLLESTTALPLTGNIATVTIPFGDNGFTVVATPNGDFGGAFAAWLQWIIAASGILLAIIAGLITERLVRQRRGSARDADEIGRLYGELGERFGAQRTIAETLQRALLPEVLPGKAGIEIATRYVAGAAGVEIGGDWYGFVPLEEEQFGFQIGDVSGRGVDAARVMAALRYSIKTLTLAGYAPSEILAESAKQIHIGTDKHFATALVGIGYVERREVTLANAGHLNPLLVNGDKTEFVPTVVGVPLGLTDGTYETVTIAIPPGATLLVFTDGLIERRGEDIDTGMKRLEEAARGAGGPLDEMLANLLKEMTNDATEDDIAMLALRWTT